MQRDQAHQQRGDQVERVEQEQKHLRLAASARQCAARRSAAAPSSCAPWRPDMAQQQGWI